MDDLAAKLKRYRLSRSEYELACQNLGRELQGLEWAVHSALWSEHCSYKSSKVYLKTLFSKNEITADLDGENAGVIDLGQGERVAFKMESHNHPSFIEPYQGAATGVGGILRDIFTMGAKPVALTNMLYFGEPEADRMPHLERQVVKGIGDYGNCVGVPMVTGQTWYHPSYNKNILVNAMAVGYFPPGSSVLLSGLKKPGSLVVYVGAKTGRDGIHGASMASEEFQSQDKDSKRPTIQIGDPFFEKLLIEACLEVAKKGLVLSMQDMGAAGLTSSSFEMSAKSGLGIRMDLSAVPLRDSSMGPEEILLSESQERMLLEVSEEKFSELKSVFDRFDLECVVIGTVKNSPEMELLWKAERVFFLDPKVIVEKAPQYQRPVGETSAIKDLGRSTPGRDVNLCSKAWIYRQFDQRVGGQTAKDCSSPIGVIRLPHSKRGLGIVNTFCPELAQLHGAKVATAFSVCEGVFRLSLYGFKPLAMTNCLNFASPERASVMHDFQGAISAMNLAAKLSNTPIISGNVSFYNETDGSGILPTPSIGMLGLRDEGVEGLLRDRWTEEPEAEVVGGRTSVVQLSFSDLLLSSDSLDNFEIKWRRVLEVLKDWRALVNETHELQAKAETKAGLEIGRSASSAAGLSSQFGILGVEPIVDVWRSQSTPELRARVLVSREGQKQVENFAQKWDLKWQPEESGL